MRLKLYLDKFQPYNVRPEPELLSLLAMGMRIDERTRKQDMFGRFDVWFR